MSGSLYTPYPVAGQPTSGGQAFREGFLGAQQIESNVQEMERRRQAARFAELQEQRSQQNELRLQAAEARAAERFPLEQKQAAAGISRTQQLLPLELDQSRLNLQRTQLQLRETEQALRDRAALTRALQEGFPTINFGGAPQTAPVPAAGVAVPPAVTAPVTAPADVTPPAAVPGPQSSVDGRPSWLNADFGNRRFTGVQEARPGMSDAGPAAVEPGAPIVRNDPVIVGRPPSQPYIDRPMRVQADLNRLQTEYNDLRRLYRIAATSRDVATATRVVTRVREIQNEVNLLRGMQAITSFRDGDDAPLAAAIAEATRGSNQMQIQRAPDGTYNIFRGGRLVNTGVSREQVVANTRLYFDTEFRQEIQAARQRSIDEAILRTNEGIKQTARMTAEIAIERVKQELARSAPNIEVRAVPNADGTQNLIYVDRSTSPPTTIGGARVVRVPPRPGSPRDTPDTFAIEAIPVTRN